MKKGLLFLLPLAAAILVGCGKNLDTRYLDASLGRSLELPPDLDRVEVDSQFELPRVFSGDDPERRDAVPVLVKVESLRLQGSGDFYWLEVDAGIEDLYDKLRGFWASEGYRLVIDEPVIGIMMTEWIFKEEGGQDPNASWLQRLLEPKNLAASQDQFRTRIERIEGGPNRVYIVHRGTSFQQAAPTSDRNDAQNQLDFDSDWSFRQSEPELEIEMLSRLMVYLGLQEAEAEQQIADLRMFTPRAYYYVDADGNSPYLILRDAYHVAWNRVYHQLERMNFEIELSEFRSGLMGEGVIQIGAEVEESAATEQDDEDDGGGLFSLFSSANDDEAERRRFVLVLSEETHEMTRVEIETLDGELDSSREGAAVIDLLYREVR